MEFQLIPSGRFKMGSPRSELKRDEDEFQHDVEITKPFYMGTFEVTRGQFAQFVSETNYKTEAETDGKRGGGWNAQARTFESTSSKFSWKANGFAQSDKHPVVNVSWNDAVEFCRWLSRKDGRNYRLPTEAEWEYACRGESKSAYSFGANAEQLKQNGNYADKSIKSKFDLAGAKYHWAAANQDDGAEFTNEVGMYLPNQFGVFDMHGNMWEWCEDWYNGDYYRNSIIQDPAGPRSGSYRVLRGGSWNNKAEDCRSANRVSNPPTFRGFGAGFRVILDP